MTENKTKKKEENLNHIIKNQLWFHFIRSIWIKI